MQDFFPSVFSTEPWLWEETETWLWEEEYLDYDFVGKGVIYVYCSPWANEHYLIITGI